MGDRENAITKCFCDYIENIDKAKTISPENMQTRALHMCAISLSSIAMSLAAFVDGMEAKDG